MKPITVEGWMIFEGSKLGTNALGGLIIYRTKDDAQFVLSGDRVVRVTVHIEEHGE